MEGLSAAETAARDGKDDILALKFNSALIPMLQSVLQSVPLPKNVTSPLQYLLFCQDVVPVSFKFIACIFRNIVMSSRLSVAVMYETGSVSGL
jgi:hypothetical protein